MGCCPNYPNEPLLRKKTIVSQTDDIQSLIYSSNGIPATINDPIIIIQNITLNPLGLTLWNGMFKKFKILKEKMQASPDIMETLLEKQGLSGIEIIMTKGYIKLLEYYLPEYLLSLKVKIEDSEVFKKPLIHAAIANGHNKIVKFVYEYFADVYPPPAFDVNHIDPKTGENSALIACKSCNYRMIKYLKEVCNADFSIINNKNQNALQLLAIGSKKIPISKEIIVYLIQACKVNVLHEYEEILDNIDDLESVDYIQKALKENGIFYNRDTITDIFITKNLNDSQPSIAAMSSITNMDSTMQFSFSVLDD